MANGPSGEQPTPPHSIYLGHIFDALQRHPDGLSALEMVAYIDEHHASVFEKYDPEVRVHTILATLSTQVQHLEPDFIECEGDGSGDGSHARWRLNPDVKRSKDGRPCKRARTQSRTVDRGAHNVSNDVQPDVHETVHVAHRVNVTKEDAEAIQSLRLISSANEERRIKKVTLENSLKSVTQKIQGGEKQHALNLATLANLEQEATELRRKYEESQRRCKIARDQLGRHQKGLDQDHDLARKYKAEMEKLLAEADGEPTAIKNLLQKLKMGAILALV